jgi:hypothetical protein
LKPSILFAIRHAAIFARRRLATHAYYLRFSPMAPVWKLFPDEYAISANRPGADNIGSSGCPAFDALHQLRGKVELAKF